MSDIDGLKNFWEELKERNVVKVFIFYCVASWAIIQFVDVMSNTFELTTGFKRVVYISLGIGLPIAVIAAWIFELTTEGFKKTDQVPEGKFTKRTGKILNQGITVVLGIAVILLLVDRQFGSGASAAPVLSKTDAIAVYPIKLVGDLDDDYKYGIQGLINNQLNLIPDLNAADNDLLLNEINQGGLDIITIADAAKISSAIGANRSVLGTMSVFGDRLEFTLNTYDVTGAPLGEPIIENGNKADYYNIVMKSSQRLAAEELNRKGKTFNSSAIMTAQNPDAIPPYIESTIAIKEGNYEVALEKIRESIDRDSTFILAYAKYLEIAGWLQLGLDQEIRREEYLPNLYRLQELSSEMSSGKLGEIVQAKIEFEKSDIRAERNFNRLLNKYVESSEILMGLAESVFHHRELEARDVTEAKKYLTRLLALDSTNKEVLLHLIDIAIIEENEKDAEDYMTLLEGTGTQDLNREFQILNIKEEVTDQEPLNVANQIDVDDFDFKVRPAMKQVNGLELVDRMMKLDPILEVYTNFYLRAKFSSTGRHALLVEDVFDEYLEGYFTIEIYTLFLADGHPELRFFEGKENLIIEGMNFYLEDPDIELDDKLVLQYIQGLMYLASGDESGFYSRTNTLLSYFDDNTDSNVGSVSEFSRLLYYNLKSFETYYKKEYQVSLEYIDSAVTEIREIDRNIAVNFSRTRNLFKADNYRLLGNFEKAKGVYKNLAESRYPSDGEAGSATNGATWGYLVYRLAQMHDQLGEQQDAIKYYSLFAVSYRESDDKYQPWVDESYKRLSVLSGTPEQELRSKSDILE